MLQRSSNERMAYFAVSRLRGVSSQGEFIVYVDFSRACVRIQMLVLAVLVGCLGCGGSNQPELTQVTGTVTMNGKAVGPGTVAFLPTSGTGNPATGNVDEAGKFSMSVYKPGDGVLPGEYNVAITIEKTPARGDEKGNLYPAGHTRHRL